MEAGRRPFDGLGAGNGLTNLPEPANRALLLFFIIHDLQTGRLYFRSNCDEVDVGQFAVCRRQRSPIHSNSRPLLLPFR